MRTHIINLMFLLLTISFGSCTSVNGKEQDNKTAVSTSDPIDVYYFHYTRRCATCMAVENETQKALSDLYQKEVKDKKITFRSINLDEPESEELAKKLDVSGQTLLIVSGDQKENITTDAFMYAKSNPEKLTEIIKTHIDKFMN